MAYSQWTTFAPAMPPNAGQHTRSMLQEPGPGQFPGGMVGLGAGGDGKTGRWLADFGGTGWGCPPSTSTRQVGSL
jgi:hypothetical protein